MICVFSIFINILVHAYNSPPLYLVPKRILISSHGYIKYNKIAYNSW